MPLARAAWWKKPAATHLRTVSQSVPHETNGQLEGVADVLELGAHLAGLAEHLGVEKVGVAPGVAVAVGAPLGVAVEQRQVVALGDVELFARGVGLVLPLAGPVKDRGDREHGDDGKNLGRAAVLGRGTGDEHLAQARLHGELGHALADEGEVADVVERTQDPELEHGSQEVVLGRRVHKVKLEQVLYAEALEQEHRVGQVCALDLGNAVLKQLLLEGRLGVEAVGAAGARASGAAGALVGIGAADGRDLERVHAHTRIVDLELAVAGVDDVHDAVDGERRLGNVGGDDALALAVLGRVEDLGLQVGGICE
ncbi:hypothetical protein L7F22_000554 [Adiantum nelumboides]|nr:hypothetical protein [Adiantum nelumboides]